MYLVFVALAIACMESSMNKSNIAYPSILDSLILEIDISTIECRLGTYLEYPTPTLILRKEATSRPNRKAPKQ
jgi:hypothetical protein